MKAVHINTDPNDMLVTWPGFKPAKTINTRQHLSKARAIHEADIAVLRLNANEIVLVTSNNDQRNNGLNFLHGGAIAVTQASSWASLNDRNSGGY